VRRVRLGEAGVTCCLDHFGPDGPEAFSEGTSIYINRDHPLYVRNGRRRETHALHVARLLAQEISMMKDPRSPGRRLNGKASSFATRSPTATEALRKRYERIDSSSRVRPGRTGPHDTRRADSTTSGARSGLKISTARRRGSTSTASPAPLAR